MGRLDRLSAPQVFCLWSATTKTPTQDSSLSTSAECLPLSPDSLAVGLRGKAKVDRPVYLARAGHPVIAKRRQIDESTRITRGYAQLPWCNR